MKMLILLFCINICGAQFRGFGEQSYHCIYKSCNICGIDLYAYKESSDYTFYGDNMPGYNHTYRPSCKCENPEKAYGLHITYGPICDSCYFVLDKMGNYIKQQWDKRIEEIRKEHVESRIMYDKKRYNEVVQQKENEIKKLKRELDILK